ncbi:MAG: hypothetical protein A2284_11910 [Deltaproteobacteria bacterium RIFOXYA12_FULL_61_11]|nr:MAG: hypothetical protein A2284_11910 [Deltaproteobacteria bacterium RIFOXYA12_FULL_61_11]
MAETIDEITAEWTDEEGKLVVKELRKEILTRGQWTTIMFMIQELDKRSGEYGSPKVRIDRYQKRSGSFSRHSKFTISSKDQAMKVVKVLLEWFSDETT